MAPPGLTPAELGTLREALDAGRQPRVTFTESAGQMAHRTGQVVALKDPATTAEWIMVRFDGDELPFAPEDLTLHRRASRSAGGTRTRQTQEPAPERSAPARAKPSRPSSGQSKAATATTPTAESGASSTKAAPADGTRTAASAPAARTPATPSVPAEPPPPDLEVTISYANREWRLTASAAGQVIVPGQEIRPADALRMVSVVEAPALHQAVESMISAERAAAEGRARQLRAELAEIESRLSGLAARCPR